MDMNAIQVDENRPGVRLWASSHDSSPERLQQLSWELHLLCAWHRHRWCPSPKTSSLFCHPGCPSLCSDMESHSNCNRKAAMVTATTPLSSPRANASWCSMSPLVWPPVGTL